MSDPLPILKLNYLSLLLSYKRSHCQTYVLQILFTFLWVVFLLSYIPFVIQKFLILKYSLSVVLFVGYAWGVKSKKLLPNPVS